MPITLVHDWLTGMRGGEKCLEVACRNFPDAELLTLLHQPGRTSSTIDAMRIRTSYLQRLPGRKHYRYMLPMMPRAIERLRPAANTELVLSFSHAVAKSIVPPPGVPHVCYCFTPMRYAWQLRGDYFRTETPEGKIGVFAGKVFKAPVSAARDVVLDRIRNWDQETADRVTHYVAISRTIAQRIADCYGRESTLIYPPVDTEFYTPANVAREDFYLCVSALAPYKRIDLAIEACNRSRRKLVVIGDGQDHARLERLAGPTIELRGWQPDEVIRDAMRHCKALLFPGLEDFGIVPLEAQACGAAVIAFGQGGATETVLSPTTDQPGTGTFFAEQTPDSLNDAIERFEHSPQSFSANRARSQAEQFATARFERELLTFLAKVRSQQHVAA
ncbi:MAG: glycosyltransferase [Pirellulales bacterium]|nr:glycosyltransferase [Pirellulales bacterium]